MKPIPFKLFYEPLDENPKRIWKNSEKLLADQLELILKKIKRIFKK